MTADAATLKPRNVPKTRHRQGITSVIKDARARWSPTARQVAKAKKVSNILLERITKEAAAHLEIVGVCLGGSYKKDTWLARPEMDIDVYIKFKQDVSKSRFRKIAIDVGFAALKGHSPYLKFSDHPYVEAEIDKNILANVVPCYDISRPQEWKSAADRSQFHTKHMAKNLTKNMKSDVRLLKAFLKANGLYGAQIATNGFSGYASEVLIAHYGSFEKMARGFAHIEPGTVIGKAARKFDNMISIMDPIDKNRNLASAISDRNMVRFILACRAFVAKPSADFFDGRRMLQKSKTKSAATYWNHILTVRFGFKKRAPDVIWGQSKKTMTKFVNLLERDGFTALRYKTHVDTDRRVGYLFVLLDSVIIPPGYVQDGPEFVMQKSLETYIKKGLADETIMMWVNSQGKLVSLRKRKDMRADRYALRMLKNRGSGKEKTLLPPDCQSPKVWIGRGDLKGAAKSAAEELIMTDAAIIHHN